jgi:uncharacterized protein (DUF1778 family)
MTAQAAKTKAERFNIRATGDEKRLVEEAAAITRVSTSRFVMQAAVRSAEEVLSERTRFVLPADRWADFVARLDQPTREIPALRRAAAKPSPFVAR